MGITVDPAHLESLAVKQDQASGKAGQAVGAASEFGWQLWVTHGVISGISNGAIELAAGQRRGACQNIATAAHDLAAKLRTAKQTYEGVDQDLSGNLDKQMLER
jgi:Excreted virulence factor EspC, type VII ESX diderm